MIEKRADRLHAAAEAYFSAFGQPNPEPFGIDDDTIAYALERAVARGRPIDPDYDWWAQLPPGADA